ncbi:MAG: Flp family type IVb pilin [Planctomycetota bacterium]|jgi:Flp pilus assembly pilin Flp
MSDVAAKLKGLWRDDSGLEVVEYAIILSLIVAAALTALTLLGAWTSGVFDTVNERVGAGE